MDKRTLLAVVLMVLVIVVYGVISFVFFQPAVQPQATATTSPVSEKDVQSGNGNTPSRPSGTPVQGDVAISISPATEEESGIRAESVVITTNRYIATFSTAGGVLTSLELTGHNDNNKYVDMLFGGKDAVAAFDIRFGGPEAEPVRDLYRYRKSENSIEFYRTYTVKSSQSGEPVPFTLRKKYIFTPDDYMIGLDISIENSVNEIPNIVNSGYAYTLGFGPQIGPSFTDLDGQRDFRKFFTFNDKKRQEINPGKQKTKAIEQRYVWSAIAGKYFTVIAIPDATLYKTTFASGSTDSLKQTNEIYFSRPPLRSSKNTDVFRFYIGPKLENALSPYNDSTKNGFGTADLGLNKVMDYNPWLGWLESILKFILVSFYNLIPNYGVAIILLTILTKVAMFPLTRKSIESTSKMQTLAPKIEELKQKYKNNPNKMNQEMAELYKREGANPLSGCLPMLLQLPIFLALFGLLNTHFDLRGSVFIPGWITDLSSPEFIAELPFTIPILGWDYLRLLPFIYVGTQILTQKFTTAPDSSANANMKMMMYILPLVFFFIMYNMPSGLLLYWTMTNILGIGQQIYTTRHLKAKRAAGGESPVRK